MLERLDYIKLAPLRILDAGCATGRGAVALANRYPGAQVLGLDHALPLLLAARAGWLKRALARERFTRVCADIEGLPLKPASIDLAWSNLALHGLADPLPALKDIHRVLKIGGLLMFSCYGPDTLKELRSAFAADAGRAHVHPFFDMHDLGDMLAACGYADPVMDMEVISLTYADVDGLFADLRATGQVNVAEQRRRGLTGKGVFAAMRAAYDKLRHQGRLPASFEIVCGHAWKPEPRLTEDGRSVIKLEPRMPRPRP